MSSFFVTPNLRAYAGKLGLNNALSCSAESVLNFLSGEVTKGRISEQSVLEIAKTGGRVPAQSRSIKQKHKQADPQPRNTGTQQNNSPSKNTAAQAPTVKQIEAIVQKAVSQVQQMSKKKTQPNANTNATTATKNMVRVKEAHEQYSTTRKSLLFPTVTKTGHRHPMAERPATFCKRQLNEPSELDAAICGAFFKFMVTQGMQQIPRFLKMTEHDHQLVKYAIHNLEWRGYVGGDAESEGTQWVNGKLTDWQRKAILDDGTSGGLEAVPIIFDEGLITTPVLFGELFPHVDVRETTRRRVEGAFVLNPTFTTTAEGTAMSVFNTDSFVSAFDTSIYPAHSLVEIGLDFTADSPVNLGKWILEMFGNKAAEWLDRVIAIGNGTDEPLGIFNGSGLTTVSSDMGTTGPATLSDVSGLMFGLPAAIRREAGAKLAYVGNDTTYHRLRRMPVGQLDQRGVFGMDYQSYELLGNPYCIQNGIPNNKLAFCNLQRYILYRRQPLTIRAITEGITLARSNTMYFLARHRYGGQPGLGAAFAIMTDAQA